MGLARTRERRDRGRTVSAPPEPDRLLPRLYGILGAPGLTIGLFSLVSLSFGLYVLATEYDRLRVSGRAALRPVINSWVRTTPVHYLGLTIADYADTWRRAPGSERAARLTALRRALGTLGETLDAPRGRAPLLHVEALALVEGRGSTLAAWRPAASRISTPTELAERVILTPASPSGPEIDLIVSYRLAPEVERMAVGLETSYHRLLWAIVGLSAYSLLCLAAMVLHVRALRDRVARESAQQATLDLADRTCHELGNVAFVLTNERGNLSDYLDLVSRFVAEIDAMIDAAARRAGLDAAQVAKLRNSLQRQYAERGLDPQVELVGGSAIARDVCKQIAVCSDYIALTVRELDAYLKQSALPVVRDPVDPSACLDDALALLAPALEASNAHVERRDAPARAWGDRRLLVHALVNLVKNALEAATGSGISPVLTLKIRTEDSFVWIDVIDNGPGIASEQQSRIFDVGVSTKNPGRGRGLAIVRESVQIQGGQIHLESAPGRGSRFSIGLPAAGEADDLTLQPPRNGDRD
jgi:signal transduction histidine kinase